MSAVATIDAPPRLPQAAASALRTMSHGAATRKLPIIPLRCLAVLLLVSNDAVLALAESGRLPWLFNIASVGAAKRELRLPFQDALDVLLEREIPARTFDAVLDSVFPATVKASGVVRAVTLQSAFCASQQLIARHIEDGELEEIGRRSVKESPAIAFPSVRKFLNSRRVS